MGFIDYHGTKENRYTEVLDYARAQQQEDWKRKQTVKIKKWLEGLNGNSSMADMYIQDLLKTVIVRHRDLLTLEQSLTGEISVADGVSIELLWKDYTFDLIRRHVDPFHMDVLQRNKHFDAFLTRIFKTSTSGGAEEFFQNITDKPEYRRYLIECFDPAWKDQQFFKYMSEISRKDKSKREVYEKFLATYRQLGLTMALYLYQAAQTRDDGWMLQEAEEWNALSDLLVKVQKGTLTASDRKKIVNPLLVRDEEKATPIKEPDPGGDITKEPPEENIGQRQTFEDIAAAILQSKLRKSEFKAYMKKADIPSYVNACILLLECDLPEDIRSNYDQLISRMPVLQDSVDKFDEIYHADLDQFKEYFAPEALQLTATYLDYQAAEPPEKILQETRENVLIATRKLLQVVNEKIDEIYKFVTIDANAEAKALEAIISQGGYVDPEYNIKKNGGV